MGLVGHNMDNMKKILSIVVICLLSIAVQAQKFVCSDLNFYGSDLSQKEIQDEKKRTLGSKAVLDIYDNYLKIVSTYNNAKSESYVLDKVNDTEYKYSEKTSYGYTYRMVIKLQKYVAYIKGFTIDVYKDNKLQGKVTYKRD